MNPKIIVPQDDYSDILARIADDHSAMLERKLTEVLNDHGVALDEPGVALRLKQNGCKFIYTLEKDDVVLSTFGFELDLTGVKDYTRLNDIDLSKILV